MMKVIVVMLLAAGLMQAETATEIVAKAAQSMLKANRLRDDYTYKEKSVSRELGSDGAIRKTEETEKEIIVFAGQQVERVIEKDGKPLARDEARKQQAKVDKAAAEASKLSPEQVQERLEKRDREFAKTNGWLAELPSAFHFTTIGEQSLENRQVYVIKGVPDPGYKGKDAHLFHCVAGTLYIAKTSYTLVRMDGEFLDDCSFGLFLAKVLKGSHMDFQRVLVNNEVWLPKEVSVSGEGRALFKKFDDDLHVTYSDYRKFTAESHIVASSE